MKNPSNKQLSISTFLVTAFLLIAGIAISQDQTEDASHGKKMTALNGLSELGQLNKLSALNSKVDDEKAMFPGGMKALTNYIIKNLKYPKSAKKKGVEGKVFVSFTVDQEGNCKDFKVKKGVNKELDAAALKALKGMPQWTPAKKDGKSVASVMTLPIMFALDSEESTPPPPPPPPAPEKAPKQPKQPKTPSNKG